MSIDYAKQSKFLSYVLRHRPDEIGILLDDAGWVEVDVLLKACARHGTVIRRDELDRIVATSDKQRFAFSDDRTRIRANQGHSVAVDLGYAPATPPDVLYHGTPESAVKSILRTGLQRRERHHVHLSERVETATKVGERRGRAIVLVIDAKRMHEDGIKFYVTPNRVWLVDEVPAKYIAVVP